MAIEHYGYYSGSDDVKTTKENPNGTRVGALSTMVEARKGFEFNSTYTYYTFEDDDCGNRYPSLSINPL